MPARGGCQTPAISPTEQLLTEAGISSKLQRAATVDLVLPDNIHDTEAFERCLREYIAFNINAWVGRRPRNLWMVFAALKDTYALDMKRYTSLLEAAKADAAARQPARRVKNGMVTLRYAQPSYVGTPPAASAVWTGHAPSATLPTTDNAGDVHTADRAGPVPTHPRTTELTLPAYDPDYDVAAGLPKYIRDKKCEAGCLKGFGNYEAEAVAKYYWRNKVRIGGNWEMFGLPCKVFEEYDAKGRSYLVAMADVYTPRQESEQWAHYGPMDWTEIAAELSGVSTSAERVSHRGARASSSPLDESHTDAFEQDQKHITTKDTKGGKVRVLRGESPNTPSGSVPPALESISPALVGNHPAAGSRLHSQECVSAHLGSRLHRQQYVSAQAHEALPSGNPNPQSRDPCISRNPRPPPCLV